ncbi:MULTISPECIES: nucleotidyltransferase domain-containing protein [unclassified Nocardiopsis]|uniref:nucleotidyltransferase domain-containing protein n=1 Tax=Nocardiopsis TaxID=2013 RepID=UPI00387B59D9
MPPHTLAARVDRLRSLAERDARVEGVLLYGSWTTGEADEHSDLEAYVYVRDPEGFDAREFVAGIAPVRLARTNMFGILAVVFDDLMRGEFHVEPADAVEELRSWRGSVHLPDPGAAVLLDRTGRLTEAAKTLTEPLRPDPAGTAQRGADELAVWTLMLTDLLARGEVARAHNLLHAMVSPQQLKLLRLLRGSTDHWLTPSRGLERDVPAADLERYRRTTGPALPEETRAAARESWAWTRDLVAEAADRWGVTHPADLHEAIADRLA